MATPPSGSPLIALAAPITVLVLLLACATLRRAVRRRRSSIGPSALETFPWSWLSVCVEDRRARPDPWGDGDDNYYAQCVVGSYAVEQQQEVPMTAAAVERDACCGKSEKEQGGDGVTSSVTSPTFPKPVFHFENFDFARADGYGKDALGIGSGGAGGKETPLEPAPAPETRHGSEELCRNASKPPILRLPSHIGAPEGRWELETKQL
ncbi:hypothetical protein RB595_002373 [Gaeumannomyces hyphopodioides]